MEIRVLASSSRGNCYLLDDGSSALMLECGLPIRDILRHTSDAGWGYHLHGVAACLVSHEHKDHSKAVPDLLRLGIKVYMTRGTGAALNLTQIMYKPVQQGLQFNVAGYTILPFEVQHDAMDPCGWYIHSHYSGDRVLFATDTYFMKYRFEGLTHIMLECNYDEQTMAENLESGSTVKNVRDRVRYSHFSLENVIRYLDKLDLGKVQAIYLLHLSNANANEDRIRTEVMRATGKQVIIA